MGMACDIVKRRIKMIKLAVEDILGLYAVLFWVRCV